MFKLIFTNVKGESIELFGHPFRLISVSGLGDVEANIQMQKAPYQDGSTYIDAQLQERIISIDLKIEAYSREKLESYRRLLSAVLNPKLGEGVLQYIGESVKEIRAISEHVPYFPDGSSNRGRWFQRATIDLICPDPYWKSEQIVSKPMTAYRGLFRFPLTLPTQFGEEGTTQVFVNDGDVDTPVQIEFRGPATNPRVTNKTTGEFIQINKELEESDKLIVDTTFGNKRVEIIRPDGSVENVFNWVHPFSTFWNLIPGPNEIEYTAESGRTNAVVSIKWKNRYLTV